MVEGGRKEGVEETQGAERGKGTRGRDKGRSEGKKGGTRKRIREMRKIRKTRQGSKGGEK